MYFIQLADFLKNMLMKTGRRKRKLGNQSDLVETQYQNAAGTQQFPFRSIDLVLPGKNQPVGKIRYDTENLYPVLLIRQLLSGYVKSQYMCLMASLYKGPGYTVNTDAVGIWFRIIPVCDKEYLFHDCPPVTCRRASRICARTVSGVFSFQISRMIFSSSSFMFPASSRNPLTF